MSLSAMATDDPPLWKKEEKVFHMAAASWREGRFCTLTD